jgi:UDP-2,3-diacylglucosamine hydrolase
MGITRLTGDDPITDRPEYFLSDAHFGAHDGRTERLKIDRFVSFLSHPERHGAIVWFLGDLFDFWLEYRHAIPRVSVRVLAAIQAFVADGGEFHLLLGNHDYWVRDYFLSELGVIVHPHDVNIVRGGKQILLTHGDGKAPSDGGYRLLRYILRFRPGIWVYRHLPVDWAFALASSTSHSSRRLTSGRTDKFAAEYRVYAEKILNTGVHAVIFGHLHRAFVEQLGAGWYINSGEWFETFSYVLRGGSSFSLHHWNG